MLAGGTVKKRFFPKAQQEIKTLELVLRKISYHNLGEYSLPEERCLRWVAFSKNSKDRMCE